MLSKQSPFNLAQIQWCSVFIYMFGIIKLKKSGNLRWTHITYLICRIIDSIKLFKPCWTTQQKSLIIYPTEPLKDLCHVLSLFGKHEIFNLKTGLTLLAFIRIHSLLHDNTLSPLIECDESREIRCEEIKTRQSIIQQLMRILVKYPHKTPFVGF